MLFLLENGINKMSFFFLGFLLKFVPMFCRYSPTTRSTQAADHCRPLLLFPWFSILFQAKMVHSQLYTNTTSLPSTHKHPGKGTNLYVNWWWVNFDLKQATSFCLTSAYTLRYFIYRMCKTQ